ncbi:MAG: ComEA family DNA-binding protein [Ruminococcus sp.]|jgi:competence protein ComEA|nr:ComEA family DNA-binding protein [Ruminococcus sp.]
MNNPRGKILAVAAVFAVALILCVLGYVRERSVPEALPVVGTVVYGSDFDGGITAKDHFTEIRSNAETMPQQAGAVSVKAEKPPAVININTADKEKLMTLPGIGEATAEAIIEYREIHGAFKAVEELLEVSGIGEAKLNKLKDLVTVGDVLIIQTFDTTPAVPESEKVNINTDSADKLMTLPGVGEATAEKIIAYRENKPFEKPEDLLFIDGIGETKFEEMKPYVTVE